MLAAAGASRRMRGCDKLLEDVGGMPLLRQQAMRALATGLPVLVTLPPGAAGRRAALGGLDPARLMIAALPDAPEGMAASIRAGAGWALDRGAGGLMVVLADMPEVTTDDMMSLVQRFDFKSVLRGCNAAGRPGHPVLFPAGLFAALTRVRGDQGARDVLRGAPVALHRLPWDHALTDLDTPEDWAAWRTRRRP